MYTVLRMKMTRRKDVKENLKELFQYLTNSGVTLAKKILQRNINDLIESTATHLICGVVA